LLQRRQEVCSCARPEFGIVGLLLHRVSSAQECDHGRGDGMVLDGGDGLGADGLQVGR
jgi:hypothetical protein